MAAEGFYLVQGDRTTCGGKITTGAEDHTLFDKPVAREQDSVTCGKHAGLFKIAGGIDNDTIHDRRMAGTLDSYSTCPCKAKFIPSMMDDTYEKSSAGAAVSAEEPGKTSIANALSQAFLAGAQADTILAPGYPTLINTHTVPDDNVRGMLRCNRHDFLLLTMEECQRIIDGWDFVKKKWKDATTNPLGNTVKTYATNIDDVGNASAMVYKLGSIGITATVFVNHKGTRLIKISGYAAVRKILNTPVFGEMNPKIIEAGVGKFGLQKSIVDGAILGFVYVSVMDTIDFILNDETTLAKFLGTLATDLAKVGISSAALYGVGLYTMTSFVVLNLAVVVIAGIGIAVVLNYLDSKYHITDRLVNFIAPYIESAQQEFVEKSREVSDGILDLGAMYVDGMLRKGRQVIEAEVKQYVKKYLGDLTSQAIDL
ncbi:PAAR domain-containing protein [Enterobacter sp. JMULE2]|uniref:PAAR domain-containing protein n=1 Tax=Enterobacter sp. JMULE2 TaxID=2518340 RepID=UPI00157737B1|nr:PAAR domain-containing protein [Enterobacter sp. JMULE2]NTZ40843.1 PAAR domain-containing protein [Enterobacter sp. JMULE2]